MDKSWKFIVAFVLCLFGLLVGYGVFFRNEVVRDQTVVPVSYKQLLLESIPGPRILIESGSNGLHAFDASLVESLTGYPTLILADHAGASLHDKVERLRRYAVAGDVVILPLEWNYYHAPDLSENHLKSIMDRGRGYYYSLPLAQQCWRAYSMPFADVLTELLLPSEARDTSYIDELNRLEFYYHHHFLKAPNGGIDVGAERKQMPEDSDCDEYILPEFAQGAISFTKDFESSLRKLAKLQNERQITIILTAPIVVGKECYAKYGASLVPMVETTKALCEKLGLRCRLDFKRYAMPSQYLWDTHFHVTVEGRAVVTPLVIGDLMASGCIPALEGEALPPVVDQVEAILYQYKLQLFREKMPVWRGNPTAVVDGDDREQFYFGDDWYAEEEWGRWATSEVASVVVRPDPAFEYSGIYVNANYFQGSQATKVFINDQFVVDQDFTENHVIEFEDSLSNLMAGDSIAVIRFESSGEVSPHDVDVRVSDVRKLKFGLHSLELILKENDPGK